MMTVQEVVAQGLQRVVEVFGLEVLGQIDRTTLNIYNGFDCVVGQISRITNVPKKLSYQPELLNLLRPGEIGLDFGFIALSSEQNLELIMEWNTQTVIALKKGKQHG